MRDQEVQTLGKTVLTGVCLTSWHIGENAWEHMTINSWKTHAPHGKMGAIEIEGAKRTGDEKMGTAKHAMRHLGVLFNATASLEESINMNASAALRNTAGS